MGATHTDEHKLKSIIKASYDRKGQRGFAVDDRFLKYFVEEGILNANALLYDNVNYIAEKKIDGYSYINDEGEFFSKSLSTAKGNEGAPINKTGWMPHLKSTMDKFASYGADVHGELHIPGKTSDDVTTILGCTMEEAIRRQEENLDMKLHFVIFDIRRYNGEKLINLPWYARRALLEYLFRKIDVCEYVTISEIMEDPIEAFRNIVANGGEGLVFKNTMATYIPGKKPANVWVKAKKSVTLDAFIMGFNDDGSGKNSELFKSIKIGIMIDGKETYVGNVHSGISDTLRAEMHNNRGKWIGRVIEVEAMDYNKKKYSFRHARLERLRDDKLKHECITDGIKVCLDLL